MIGGIFVTGTDTGVGKTIISGLLGRYLMGKGYNVIIQKWVQSAGRYTDVDECLKLMGKPRSEVKGLLDRMCCYSFSLPASPHLCARIAHKKISPEKIKQDFKYLAGRSDVVIVEGTGGALVPYNQQNLLIDIAADLQLPVLIVAANRLGAINHTLLTVGALKKRNMKIIGIVFDNQRNNEKKLILDDNPRIIKTLTKEKVLGTLLWMEKRDQLYKEFLPIARNIVAAIDVTSPTNKTNQTITNE